LFFGNSSVDQRVLFLDQFPRNWLEKPEEEKRSEPGISGETLTP
jgi:hypothetical protein